MPPERVSSQPMRRERPRLQAASPRGRERPRRRAATRGPAWRAGGPGEPARRTGTHGRPSRHGDRNFVKWPRTLSLIALRSTSTIQTSHVFAARTLHKFPSWILTLFYLHKAEHGTGHRPAVAAMAHSGRGRHDDGEPPTGELPGEPARPRQAAARLERTPGSLPARAEEAGTPTAVTPARRGRLDDARCGGAGCSGTRHGGCGGSERPWARARSRGDDRRRRARDAATAASAHGGMALLAR